MLKQLDVVELIDERAVKFMSGPKGRPTTPKGHWSVVGFIDTDVILAKDQTVIRTPFKSIRKIASYNLAQVLEMVDKAKPVF